MTSCSRCGHDVGQGRFCARCGNPVAEAHQVDGSRPEVEATQVDGLAGPEAPDDSPDDWRTGTAERPRVPAGAGDLADPQDPEESTEPGTSPWATAEPATGPAQPPPRWPLYADEVTAQPRAVDPEPEPATVVPALAVPSPGQGRAEAGPRHGRVLPWVVGAAVVVLLAGLGALLLLGGLGSGDEQAEDTAVEAGAADAETEPDPTSAPSSRPSPSPTPSPDPSPTRRPTKPVDVTETASVRAPETAPPGVDVDGDPVRYDAANMLDGDPSTAWRTAGDGSGLEITVALDRRTVVTQVGLINGYAKSEPGYDGYTANRRITSVEWVFDDGTVVAQRPGETTQLQTTRVPRATTRTVTLRLLGATAPGQRNGRDYTAVSELMVRGAPR